MKKTIFALTIAALIFGSGCSLSTKASGPVQHPAADFDKQVESGIVILDFFATWCPPCRAFAPTFTSTATKFTDILFIKIDSDKYSNLSSKFNVRSLPTIIALKDGKEIKRHTGAMAPATFDAWINKLK